MMEDQKIKIMAKLLHAGATMLDQYCPKCDNILFRLKDKKIFCPVCDQEVITISNSLVSGKDPSSKPVNEPGSGDNNKHTSSDFIELNNIYSNLISRLSAKLQNTEEITVIEKLLLNIEKALDILNKIREFQR